MNPYTKLAQTAVEQFVKTGRPCDIPSHLVSDLARQQACYVYIYEKLGKRLRSTAGYPLPRCSTLAEEIIVNAIEAVQKPHSGSPIRRIDFKSLLYRVGVTGPLQRISDAAQLNPTLFGLFVQSDQGKHAVLLPNRPGIETAQDQVATALRESGVNPRHEQAALYRFPVTYHG